MGLPNPISTIGGGIETFGRGVGKIATEGHEWIGDRTKDVVRGDVFGINRRETEDLRRTFDEKLGDNRETIAELREKLDRGDLGNADGDEMTEVASASVHGDNARTGALSKDLGEIHTVAEGDTLSGIAADTGKSVEDLLGLNPELGDGNLIRPGQEIKLDDFVATTDPVGAIKTLATPAESSPETGPEMNA